MPSILRSRLALFALMGAFLIPIGTSSLRGLTHVLTCKEQTRQPFTVVIPPEGEPEVLSSTRIARGEASELCGGLTLNPEARASGEREITIVLPISNESEYVWQGTVTLVLNNTPIPVGIGEIEPGETVTDEVAFELDPGTFELSGSLLIGP